MMDYLIENQALSEQQGMPVLWSRVGEHDRRLDAHDEPIAAVVDEIADFTGLSGRSLPADEFLFPDGEPPKAALAFRRIYRQAWEGIVVIDDCLGIKTLRRLSYAREGVSICIASDNKGARPLRRVEHQGFIAEYPRHAISFVRLRGAVHDRYTVLGRRSIDLRVFHCGSSSKDAGRRMTSIAELRDAGCYAPIIESLLANPKLTLR